MIDSGWPGGNGGRGGLPGGVGSTGEYKVADEYLHELAEVSGGRYFRGDTLSDVASAFRRLPMNCGANIAWDIIRDLPVRPVNCVKLKCACLSPIWLFERATAMSTRKNPLTLERPTTPSLKRINSPNRRSEFNL